MKKLNFLKRIEIDQESCSEKEVKLEQTKRKVNYVMTEARKQAFEKARKVRAENCKIKSRERTKR